MPSSLTWLDHDPKDRDRINRILLLFQDKESRDELGLGSIRDSFADALFPGTSTIQSRLRYMLFIPWIYLALEKKRQVPPSFAAEARRMELSLVEPLLANPDNAGVFGRISRWSLKRLPSSVYWNGLGVWGIRRINCSQGEYHRHVHELYIHRESYSNRSENDSFPDPDAESWHPQLPKSPAGFPNDIEAISLQLEHEEASFFLDRLFESQKESLITHLALNCEPVECQFPWQHPDKDSFSQNHKDLLTYGELFSTIMQGAAFLYNLMLAEEAGRKDLEDDHQANLDEWKTRLLSCPYIDKPLHTMWKHTAGRGHTINMPTKKFVQAWYRRILEIQGKVKNDVQCRLLVRNREMRLKGARSRFKNLSAREKWEGKAGIDQMSYRWPEVSTLLADLHSGLKRDGNV